MHLSGSGRSLRAAFAGVLAAACASAASAATEGGLYIAGAGFSFQVAAERAMAQNPGGRRFFLLSLPPETAALAAGAGPAPTALRQRVLAANGVLLVCRRDLDNGRVAAAGLAPGVSAVRGWPPGGGAEPPPGQRHFAGEDPTRLPASNEALRRLRAACS